MLKSSGLELFVVSCFLYTTNASSQSVSRSKGNFVSLVFSEWITYFPSRRCYDHEVGSCMLFLWKFGNKPLIRDFVKQRTAQLRKLGLATMSLTTTFTQASKFPHASWLRYSAIKMALRWREHRSNLPFLYYLSDGLHDNGRFTALFPVSIVLLDVVWGSVTLYPARQSLWRWSWWQSQVFLLAWMG